MGWNQLLNIIKENAKEIETEKQKEITQCPQCAYTPLKIRDTGEKTCPMCGWQSR